MTEEFKSWRPWFRERVKFKPGGVGFIVTDEGEFALATREGRAAQKEYHERIRK